MGKPRVSRLLVHEFPQGYGYVAGIRVAGKWLKEAGFELGDRVELKADKGRIEIRKEDDGKEVLPMAETVARYRAPVEGLVLEVEIAQVGDGIVYRRLLDGEVVKETTITPEQVAVLLGKLPLLGWHIV